MRRHRGAAIVSTMSEGLQARIDGFQRRHRITGFTYAVIKRYYDCLLYTSDAADE